jgi:hypothetical protein
MRAAARSPIIMDGSIAWLEQREIEDGLTQAMLYVT